MNMIKKRYGCIFAIIMMISLIIPFYSHADEQNSGIYTFNGQELASIHREREAMFFGL